MYVGNTWGIYTTFWKCCQADESNQHDEHGRNAYEKERLKKVDDCRQVYRDVGVVVQNAIMGNKGQEDRAKLVQYNAKGDNEDVCK